MLHENIPFRPATKPPSPSKLRDVSFDGDFGPFIFEVMGSSRALDGVAGYSLALLLIGHSKMDVWVRFRITIHVPNLILEKM